MPAVVSELERLEPVSINAMHSGLAVLPHDMRETRLFYLNCRMRRKQTPLPVASPGKKLDLKEQRVCIK